MKNSSRLECEKRKKSLSEHHQKAKNKLRKKPSNGKVSGKSSTNFKIKPHPSYECYSHALIIAVYSYKYIFHITICGDMIWKNIFSQLYHLQKTLGKLNSLNCYQEGEKIIIKPSHNFLKLIRLTKKYFQFPMQLINYLIFRVC